MARHQEARQFTPPLAMHGEGAYWDEGRGAWLWVDMLAGRLMITSDDGVTQAHPLPDPIAAAARPVESGEVIVVGERTVWLLHPSSGATQRLLDLDLPDRCRANEAALTRSGGLAVATMAYDATPGAGSVQVIARDGSVNTALKGVSIANGTVYREADVLFVDSLRREIGIYRDMGTHWARDGVIVEIADGDGFPDGICVDAEGAVWVALWSAGRVQRWSPEGTLLDVVTVPVTQPTSVSLGGVDGHTLLITTSAHQLPENHGTQAGALFCATVDVPGVVEPPLKRGTVDVWAAHGTLR